MKFPTLAAAAFALAATAAPPPASGQIAPGIRAPSSIADAAGQAWLVGCFFAASERPAPGINMGMELAGEGVRRPDVIPDSLSAFIATLPAETNVAILGAPGGEIWIFYHPRTHRCVILPNPVDAPGLREELATMVGPDDDWLPVSDAEGLPAGVAAVQQSFPAYAPLRRPAATLRVWYQPAAGPESPQMIVTERIAEPRGRRRKR